VLPAPRALAVGPFPLWRPVDPTAPPDPFAPFSSLPEHLHEWEDIYLTMARVYGIDQERVDGMELWVIAKLLNPSGQQQDDGLLTRQEFNDRAAADLAQRVASAGLTAPAPTIPGAVREVTDEELAQLGR
jgi:hypothetical protein